MPEILGIEIIELAVAIFIAVLASHILVKLNSHARRTVMYPFLIFGVIVISTSAMDVLDTIWDVPELQLHAVKDDLDVSAFSVLAYGLYIYWKIVGKATHAEHAKPEPEKPIDKFASLSSNS